MKKITLIFTLILVNLSLFSQVKKYIPIVKPVLYEKMKESFESVAKKFENENHKELAEIFRSFAMGGHGSGFVVVTDDGENFIITNRHVVSNCEHVNLEFLEKGSTKIVYEKCPIVYTDDDIDLAVIKFPENDSVFEKSFSINIDKQADGQEIWSAGFPGLLGKPMWQFAKGNITNEEAYVEQMVPTNISYLIQHSASIDPGNSGGPLLIQDAKSPEGYAVVGINTWSITNRQNTFFSIPSKNISVILNKVKALTSVTSNKDSLKSMLMRQCRIFSAEINSEKPNWQRVNNYISYAFVADKGWDSFIKLLGSADEETIKRLEASFFEYSPIEAMRHSILYRIWHKLYFANKDKLTIEFKGINLADEEQFGKEKKIRTDFTINGTPQEFEWTFEHGHWRISRYDLDKELNGKTDKEPSEQHTYIRKRKKYEGSKVYLGTSVLFTPYTYCLNSTLNQNFHLMGIGGALSIIFKDRVAINFRVNSVSLNNQMNNVPSGLTSASVKYLNVNNGFNFYFGSGKLRPYLLIGLNYMKFSETGAFETVEATNTFDRFGPQIGFGAKYKFNKKLGIFGEISYNDSGYFFSELMDDNYGNVDLSIVHFTIGLSFDFKKK